MTPLKEFELYLKALLECFGTTKGNPCDLEDEAVMRCGEKLRSLIAEETKQHRP